MLFYYLCDQYCLFGNKEARGPWYLAWSGYLFINFFHGISGGCIGEVVWG